MRRHYKPMFAGTSEKPFDSEDWVFEVKWDGIRTISYVDEELSVQSRNDRELIQNFPELHELSSAAPHCVLDGEIVLIREGKPDFQALMERAQSTSRSDIEYLAAQFPVTYVVFDELERRGEPLIQQPLMERKRVLSDSVAEGKYVTVSLFSAEHGIAYYEAALGKGMEGIMAKRKDSVYEPGRRSSSWLKIKRLRSCDAVVFGYTEGQGSRKGTFGALVLGLYDKGKPVFVGKVGTGFSQNELKALTLLFRDLTVQRSAFDEALIPEKVTWLRPLLICEVTYQIVTRDLRLRIPRFIHLRTDKAPLECGIDQIQVTSEARASGS